MMSKAAGIATLLVAVATSAGAQEQVLNLYSARHYSTDEALYNNFTKATGIKINRVDADDAGILARLKAEGAWKRDDGLWVYRKLPARTLWDQVPAAQPLRPARCRSGSGHPATRARAAFRARSQGSPTRG